MATSTTAQAEKWDDGTTDYVPTRAVKSDWNSKKPHVSTEPWTLSNWYRKINWINTTFVIFIPFSGLIAAYWTPLHRYTAIWAVVYYFNTGLGITGGEFPNHDSPSRHPAHH
jgi:stearoyl-CoA desaturase (delta-9 desaturase)